MKWKPINDQQISLGINDAEMEYLINIHSINRDLIYSQHAYSLELKYYLQLTYRSEVFIQADFSELDVLINRYFRFKNFYENYSIIEGSDAGIEDQITTLVYEIHGKFPNIDWDDIQKCYLEFFSV